MRHENPRALPVSVLRCRQCVHHHIRQSRHRHGSQPDEQHGPQHHPDCEARGLGRSDRRLSMGLVRDYTPCSLPRWTRWVRAGYVYGAFPHRVVPIRSAFPLIRRAGVHIAAFEACSSFTRVTACKVARPPEVDFVARFQPNRLPGLAARQLSNLTINYSSGSSPHW
jgi:hypothetical protein